MNDHIERDPRPTDRLAATLGRIGGIIGVVAAAVELSVGSSIRPWIGNKNDPTRLGIVTLLLAAVALGAATAFAKSAGPLRPSRRLALVVGMLLPALVCFTTVGRLWYVPGALLLVAAVLAAVGLRGHLRVIARDIERNGWRILAVVLAVLYLGLGITAFGTTGILGVVGALVVLNLVLIHPRLSTPMAFGILIIATVPFAVATWWSVVTPLIAVLLVVIGTAALRGSSGGRKTKVDEISRVRTEGRPQAVGSVRP